MKLSIIAIYIEFSGQANDFYMCACEREKERFVYLLKAM